MFNVDNGAFDYRGRAELARKAQLAFKNHIAEALSEVRTARNREIFAKWVEFQKSPSYQRLLTEYWAAVDAPYPPDFDTDLEDLRNHRNTKALETAVSFLEANPYFFRSGYIKEKLLRYLRGYELPLVYVGRLQHIILNVVDNHYCREFREYCRLARKINSDDLQAQLQTRLKHTDPNIRKRSQWMLDVLSSHPKHADP